jgi:hypothetical protein
VNYIILQRIFVCGTLFVAKKNYYDYFLLTEDDTCGLVFSNVVIAVLLNCMRDVWHLICLTCFGWNYVYNVVCMNILWYDMSVNKKTGGLGTKASVNWGDQRINWGLGTKASSNWLDQRINRKFRYYDINTLTRSTDKPKVEGVIVR